MLLPWKPTLPYFDFSYRAHTMLIHKADLARETLYYDTDCHCTGCNNILAYCKVVN